MAPALGPKFSLNSYAVDSGLCGFWLFALFLLGGVDCAWTELPASRREGKRTDGPLGVGDHVSDLTLGRIHTSPFPGLGSAALAIPPSTLKGPTGESYVRFTESRIWEVGGLSEDIDRSEGVDSPLQ